jgi:hypothetical protein
MSLLSEKVATVLDFDTIYDSTIYLGVDSIISPGVNYVTLQGFCAPSAFNTNYVLVDELGNQLDLENVIVLSLEVSSNPNVTVSSPNPALFTVIGLTSNLGASVNYSPAATNITVSQVNNQHYVNVMDGKSGSGVSYVNNVNYPIPGLRVSPGPGTIDSGVISVTFYCAIFL